MNKRIRHILLGLVVLLIAIIFNGCTAKLSGTFLNPEDSSNYFVFDGNTVKFYENNNQTYSGSFEVSAKTSSGQSMLTITFENGDMTTERYYLDGDREIIYFTIVQDNGAHAVGEVAFIKQ